MGTNWGNYGWYPILSAINWNNAGHEGPQIVHAPPIGDRRIGQRNHHPPPVNRIPRLLRKPAIDQPIESLRSESDDRSGRDRLGSVGYREKMVGSR